MDSLGICLLQRSLLSGVVILLLLFLRGLLANRLSPRTRHALWGFLVPVLILPVSTWSIPIAPTGTNDLPVVLQENTPATPLPEPVRPFSAELLLATTEPTEMPATIPIPPENRKTTIPLFSIFTAIWLAGALILFVPALTQLLRFRHKFRTVESITDENILSVLERCKRTMGVRSRVELVESRRILGPVLAGIVRPRIILPFGLARQSPEERLSHLLCHELAHLKRRDILCGWLMSVFCIVHWFNPLAWVAASRRNADAEEAADQLVMATLDKQKRIEYGRTLLSLAEWLYSDSKNRSPFFTRHLPGFVGLMEPSTELSRRIEMIERQGTWRRGWIFLAVLLCLAVSATTLTRVRFVEAKTMESHATDTGAKSVPLPEKSDRVPVSGIVNPPESIRRDEIDWKRLSVKYSVRFNANPNQGAGGNASLNENGGFTLDVFPDSEGIAYLYDQKNEWTAQPVFFSVDRTKPDQELVIQLEKGLLLQGTLVDDVNAAPLSGMRIWLSRRFERESGIHLMLLSLETDAVGHFSCRVLPGSYKVNVDEIDLSLSGEKERYSFPLEIRTKEEVKPVLAIPSPFTGKVLQADSDRPASDASVYIQSLIGPDWLRVKTDAQGVFRRRTPPLRSVIEITDTINRQGYAAWTGGEWNADTPWVVRLKKWKTLSGRLVDAATKKPMSETPIFYRFENPSDTSQKQEFASRIQTDKEGRFEIRNLLPGLQYEFFYVPVPYGKGYSGNSIGPRVVLDSIPVSESDPNREVGDWTADMTRLTTDPDEEALKSFEQEMREHHTRIKNEGKKGLLKAIVFREAYPTADYLKKLENEGRLDDYVVWIVKIDESPKKLIRQVMFLEKDRFLLNIEDVNGEVGNRSVTLSQLRGEKDSSWNVPRDDPSRKGDWVQTPWMPNPKILDRFLGEGRE